MDRELISQRAAAFLRLRRLPACLDVDQSAVNRIHDTTDRSQWFQETSPSKFFLIGRSILEHRAEFARRLL